MHPELRGFLDDEAIQNAITRRGWEWHAFLKPVRVAGVTFSHFFETPGKGLPIQISAFPAKLPFSAVWGHTHAFHHRTVSLPFAQCLSAVCAGTFERPRNPDFAHEWTGVVMLHGAKDGEFDLEQVSTERLVREYAA